jgi:type II restriction/modification system DNA methylase subunit YeeA
MAHLGARAFGQISGEVVQTTAWVINNNHTEFYQPVFFRLIDGSEQKKNLLAKESFRYHTAK